MLRNLKVILIGAAVTLSGCAIFTPAEPEMISRSGVIPGVLTEQILRSFTPAFSDASTYRLGGTNFAQEAVIESFGDTLNFATFLSSETNQDATALEQDSVLGFAGLQECYLKLGQCNTTIAIDDEDLPVLVQTGQSGGVWYQTVRVDGRLARDMVPRILSHSVFSVDKTGKLIDMNTATYIKREPVLNYVRRVN